MNDEPSPQTPQTPQTPPPDDVVTREDAIRLAQRYFYEFNEDCRDLNYLYNQRTRWAAGDLYIKGLLEKRKDIDIDRISTYADPVCVKMARSFVDDKSLLIFSNIYSIVDIPVTIVNSCAVGNMCLVARALRERPGCIEEYVQYMKQVDSFWSELMRHNSPPGLAVAN
jgi:hypothetical protein